eukprot:COSAG02_NODE_1238_length_13715_cov_52.786722_6_plen_44_part_00
MYAFPEETHKTDMLAMTANNLLSYILTARLNDKFSFDEPHPPS